MQTLDGDLPSLRTAPKRIEHVADIAVGEIGTLRVDQHGRAGRKHVGCLNARDDAAHAFVRALFLSFVSRLIALSNTLQTLTMRAGIAPPGTLRTRALRSASE
ncbi:hypothetical protein VSR68_26805 [Paraburkholderia phymatum]|uniref:hypothetical protein n=1 Tax=Paraburkholderia phymatum TaxID=148447 RepID=UPI00317F8C86